MRLLAILFLSGFSSLAQAEIIFQLGFNYEDETVRIESSSVEDTATRQTLNATAGYKMDMGLFLGVKHYHKNLIEDLSLTTGGVTTTTTSKELTSGSGLTAGYYADNGFVFQGSFIFLNPMRKDSTTKYFGTSALIYDIAYRWEFGDFAFGPQLSYSVFTYSKSESNGVETDIDITHTQMMPMLAMWMSI